MIEEADVMVSQGETLYGCKDENEIKTQGCIYW